MLAGPTTGASSGLNGLSTKDTNSAIDATAAVLLPGPRCDVLRRERLAVSTAPSTSLYARKVDDSVSRVNGIGCRIQVSIHKQRATWVRGRRSKRYQPDARLQPHTA